MSLVQLLVAERHRKVSTDEKLTSDKQIVLVSDRGPCPSTPEAISTVPDQAYKRAAIIPVTSKRPNVEVANLTRQHKVDGLR